MQFRGYKLVYRRYAHLYFMMCIDVNDNELAALEAIHLFVEILDHYFGQVTELDIVLSFHQVRKLARHALACEQAAVNMLAMLLTHLYCSSHDPCNTVLCIGTRWLHCLPCMSK